MDPWTAVQIMVIKEAQVINHMEQVHHRLRQPILQVPNQPYYGPYTVYDILRTILNINDVINFIVLVFRIRLFPTLILE